MDLTQQSKEFLSNPLKQMGDLQRRMWRMFPSSGFPDEESFWQASWQPPIDICNLDDKVTVRAELPGVKKEDLDVRVENGILRIRGEKKKDSRISEKDYVRTERYYGSFSRSFTMPSEVDTNNVKATFNEGILELELPKKEEAKARQQRITIQ